MLDRHPELVSAYFLFLSIDKKERATWLLLAAVCAIEYAIRQTMGWAEQSLYWCKAGVMWLGAFGLIRIGSKPSIYQASILCATSLAYLLLVYDTFATKNFGWMYDNFETIIYGLVICQLMGTTGSARRIPSKVWVVFLVIGSAFRSVLSHSHENKGKKA